MRNVLKDPHYKTKKARIQTKVIRTVKPLNILWFLGGYLLGYEGVGNERVKNKVFC